jgi:hypothetical protein
VDTIAQSFAQAAVANVAATAAVLATAAATATSQGAVEEFGRSQAQAFTVARRRGFLDSYTTCVSRAIDEGGDASTQVFGVAFAEAAAAGGDQSQALAYATALAFCQGGGTATAFASAYSAALSRNRQGCVVLTQARALAVAQCSGGQFTAFAEASAESQVLGLCGLGFRAITSPGFNINIGR